MGMSTWPGFDSSETHESTDVTQEQSVVCGDAADRVACGEARLRWGLESPIRTTL